MIKQKFAVISLSGGMDSSTLLLHLLANNYKVLAITFNYGQKHQTELYRAEALVKYLQENKLNITHNFITLRGIDQVLDSNLVKGGDEVPEGHYAEENMKKTVVPNRNKIFGSIIQAAALSLKNRSNPGDEIVIAMGIHAGDHDIYPDCRQEFRDADLKAFHLGNWDAEDINYYTPYLDKTKTDILQEGVEHCKKLGLDFDKVYKHTMTSYKPIKTHNHAFSDYKSASSIERVEAFMNLNLKDPLRYANEDGKEVSWEIVTEHVKKVLENHKK